MSAEPESSPQAEMETLRTVVTERLTAAVDDILGVFVTTVARYREQIDRQRRQLDRLRSEKWNQSADPLQALSWMKTCPGEPTPSAADATDAAAQIKTEACGFDPAAGSGAEPGFDLAAGSGAEPGFHPAAGSGAEPGFDLADGSGAASDCRPVAECSETDDSGDCWRQAAELWTPEEAEGQSSSQGLKEMSSPGLPRQPPAAFSCKVCGESFQRLSYLFAHASAHLKDCSLCGKRLELTETLKFHLRGHREAAFRCGVCGQSFTLRGNLRTHMRIHSGERPYGCTTCGKSFGRRATLVRHVRSHTGEKPFSCAYCGRGFVEKGNLTVHLRTHTGERPYWCSNCDRRFSQLASFYKHPCQRRGLTAEGPKKT